MQIISLDLENAKSYQKAHIDFTPGVNAIVGQNGAGKSTIVEAIGFALFDWLGYKHKDFVHEGEKTATITVTFISSTDDRRYQVVRKVGGNNQHYVYDPELSGKVCEGKADVLTFLRQNMGVEPGADLSRLFSDAVGVPQGAFTAAFLLTPGGRKSTFDPLLQVEEYKRAFDKLREPLSLLRDQQQELDVLIAGLAARLEQLPALEATISARMLELDEGGGLLAKAVIMLAETEEARTAMDVQQRQVAELRQRKTTLAAQLAAGEQQQASAQRALTAAQEAQALVAEHQAGHDAYVTAQSERKKVEQRSRDRQTLRDQFSAADQRLALVGHELKRVTQALAEVAAAEALVEELAPSVEKQAELEQELSSAQQAQARLQAAQRQLDQQGKALTRLCQRAAALGGQLAGAAGLEAERTQLETANLALQQQRDQRRDVLASHKAEAGAIKKQTIALEEAGAEEVACPVCEQPLTEAHRTDMLARNTRRLDEMRRSYADIQTQIKADDTALRQQQTGLKATEQALLKLPRASEVDEVRADVARRQADLAEIQALVAELDHAPQQIEALKRELATLGDSKQRHAIAVARVQERSKTEVERTELNRQRVAAKNDLAGLNAQLAEFEELDADLAAVTRALEIHADAYRQVLGSRQLAASVSQRQAELQEVEAARSGLATELAGVTSELTRAEADFDGERYAQLLGQEQQLRGEQAALKTRLAMLEGDQQRDQKALAGLREQQDALAETETSKAALAEQGAVLEALRGVLREAGPYITSTLIRQISDGAARIFGDIMQDYSRHLSWDETYEIHLNVDGAERSFAQLSGGEQMSAALALRLALLREMSNIDIAFFDEPTTNLDEPRREALARQILEVKGLRQLFVISHDDTFEQATQHLIRVEREGGASRVVVGEG